MKKPLMFDMFCGLGGATEGFLAEGWECIGIDIERHDYGSGGYPGQLWLQDIMTVSGAQLRHADFIWASPPCQQYSYRAMPWKRAKALPPPDNSLFEACFRIQHEANCAHPGNAWCGFCGADGMEYRDGFMECLVCGQYRKPFRKLIPMVVENVRGAQRWVGRAAWHYGSFYLWGDVPALMPITKSVAKVPGLNWNGSDKPGYVAQAFNTTAEQRIRDGVKLGADAYQPGAKIPKGSGKTSWFFGNTKHELRATGSRSIARKQASAIIAKIPFALARHIARCYKPAERAA